MVRLQIIHCFYAQFNSVTKIRNFVFFGISPEFHSVELHHTVEQGLHFHCITLGGEVLKVEGVFRGVTKWLSQEEFCGGSC